MPKPAKSPDRGAHTTNRVLVTLRTMLLSGEFRPGERLAELALVSRLKASRTPVRLALDRLASEGLLEPLATTGFRVSSFAIADIYDAIEIRGVLEGTAARLAAERLGDEAEVAELRRYYQEAAELLPMTLERFLRYIELNEAFHAELWKLCRSPMLKKEIERHVVSAVRRARCARVLGGSDGIPGRRRHRARAPPRDRRGHLSGRGVAGGVAGP